MQGGHGRKLGLAVAGGPFEPSSAQRQYAFLALQQALGRGAADQQQHLRLDQLRSPVRGTARRSACSCGVGVRLPGGRQNTVLVTKARSSTPAALSMRSSSWPARPTNGAPCRSSSAPGPSPMIISGASAGPRETTAWRAPWVFSGQPSKAAMAAARAGRSAQAAARALASATAAPRSGPRPKAGVATGRRRPGRGAPCGPAASPRPRPGGRSDRPRTTPRRPHRPRRRAGFPRRADRRRGS
jgi:hypothetical protein